MSYRDVEQSSEQASSEFDEHLELLDEKAAARMASTKSSIFSRYFNYALLLIQAVLLVCNVGLLTINYTTVREPAHSVEASMLSSVETPFSPMRSAMEYNIQRLDTHEEPDLYSGDPGEELDDAWAKLLDASVVRIYEDELELMNQPSIHLGDGDYLGYIEAHHALHCVRRLYQGLHPDYYVEMKEAGQLELHHMDHCVQLLRKYIQCNPDPTINTLLYDESSETLNLTNIITGRRKCVDWMSVQNWARHRALATTPPELVFAGKLTHVNGPPKILAEYLAHPWKEGDQ